MRWCMDTILVAVFAAHATEIEAITPWHIAAAVVLNATWVGLVVRDRLRRPTLTDRNGEDA